MMVIILFSSMVLAGEVNLFTAVDTCKKTASPKNVQIVKQWHLSPAVNTTITPIQELPQAENQTAIYSQLAAWIDAKKIKTVIGEGCEGLIDSNFKSEFNGWNYDKLKKQSLDAGYAKITTHVPLKLEARYGDNVDTVCGDSDALVKEGSLKLSNLRGLVGFHTRIKEKLNMPEDLKRYSEGAANILKLPKNTDAKTLLKELRAKAEKEIVAFENTLHQRNSKFVQTIQQSSAEDSALVIGGLHGADLKQQLEAKGINCTLYEPKGYNPQAESVVEDLRKALLN